MLGFGLRVYAGLRAKDFGVVCCRADELSASECRASGLGLSRCGEEP